jgi:hypothetical protein
MKANSSTSSERVGLNDVILDGLNASMLVLAAGMPAAVIISLL